MDGKRKEVYFWKNYTYLLGIPSKFLVREGNTATLLELLRVLDF